jgi:hypothetical protein
MSHSVTSLFARGRLRAMVICASLSAGALQASTLSPLSAGQDLVFGGASHSRTIQSSYNNPAAPMASGRSGYWFGLGSVGVGYEFGPVDDLVDDVERLADELDRDDLTLQEAEDLKEEFDLLLEKLGRDGYVMLHAHAAPPLMPFGGNVPFLGGKFAFGASAITSARVSILDAPIEVQPVGGGEYELQSRTSAYVKGGAGAILSLGYSANAISRRDGQLAVGTRFNYYTLELAKGVIALEDSDSDDLGDDLEDDFDRNRNRSSVVGIDVGAIWSARNYSIGGTVRNLNEPSLSYPRIGFNCADPSLSAVAQTNCFTAASFGNRIALDETHKMRRQLQVEGAVYSRSRHWSLSAAYDVNSTRDLLDDEQQWLSLAASYSGHRWWVPGLRVGYRENQAGTGLTYYTAGLTMFRLVNLDAAVSKEEVEEDGDKVPRSAMVSLSLEFFY